MISRSVLFHGYLTSPLLHLGVMVSPSGSPWKCNEIWQFSGAWSGRALKSWSFSAEWDPYIWSCNPTFLPVKKCWLMSLADDPSICLITSSDSAPCSQSLCLCARGSEQWKSGHFLQAHSVTSSFISSLRSVLTLGLCLLCLKVTRKKYM